MYLDHLVPPMIFATSSRYQIVIMWVAVGTGHQLVILRLGDQYLQGFLSQEMYLILLPRTSSNGDVGKSRLENIHDSKWWRNELIELNGWHTNYHEDLHLEWHFKVFYIRMQDNNIRTISDKSMCTIFTQVSTELHIPVPWFLILILQT